MVVPLRRWVPVAQGVRGWGGSVWLWELGCLCVGCDVCACPRLWYRVALCSLTYNGVGPEGAAAVRAVLASLKTLISLDLSI